MIIKNEIPILEYDNFSIEVIKPNHGCEELKLPELCRWTCNELQCSNCERIRKLL